MTKSNRPSPSLHDFVADSALSVLLFVIGLQLTHHKKKRQNLRAERPPVASQSRTYAQKSLASPFLRSEKACKRPKRILS